MVTESLREALGRLADTPALWVTGLYLGALFVIDLALQVGGSTVLGARVGFLGLCAVPFFLGGSSGVIRGEEKGVRGFIAAGRKYYFRILLAGGVIIAAAFLTVLLVSIPVSIIGVPFTEAMTLSIAGVTVPFVLFTFFFDTAVVFEDRKTLDSIRRSVEFVARNPGKVIGFFLVSLGISLAVLFPFFILWFVTIADRIEPIVEANQTLVFQNMTATQFVTLIGDSGVWTGLAIGFFAIMTWITLITAFKACFFRRVSAGSPAAPAPQGEFDEKGRWYRY
ncbi:MAG TPA: hypothetical protein VMB35_03175 [Methanomicrobiales archaeon]|nr:hypothetical protein [Methanomicrobiales archaeon]